MNRLEALKDARYKECALALLMDIDPTMIIKLNKSEDKTFVKQTVCGILTFLGIRYSIRGDDIIFRDDVDVISDVADHLAYFEWKGDLDMIVEG